MTHEFNHITSISVKDAISPIIMKAGPNTHVEYEGDRSIVTSHSGSVLFIEDEDIKVSRGKVNAKHSTKNPIIITVGPNVTDLKVQVGLGDIQLSYLNVNSISIDYGKGSVTATALMVRNKLSVDGGFGGVSISNSQMDEVDLNLGVGKIKVERCKIKHLKQSTGVGGISVHQSDVQYQS